MGYDLLLFQTRATHLPYRDTQMIEGMLRRGKTVDEIVDVCDYPRELVEKVLADMAGIRGVRKTFEI